MSGTISTSGAPRTDDITMTNASRAPTITNSQRTTFPTTASMCSLGRAFWTSSVVRPNSVREPVSIT